MGTLYDNLRQKWQYAAPCENDNHFGTKFCVQMFHEKEMPISCDKPLKDNESDSHHFFSLMLHFCNTYGGWGGKCENVYIGKTTLTTIFIFFSIGGLTSDCINHALCSLCIAHRNICTDINASIVSPVLFGIRYNILLLWYTHYSRPPMSLLYHIFLLLSIAFYIKILVDK